MNNLQQKTIINNLENNINLPYEKRTHIDHAYSNNGIDMFDINNAMNQLLDNDLYIQNYFNATSGYVNGPKGSSNEDVVAGANGYKSYGDIKTSDGLEILKKVDAELSDTVNKMEDGDVSFIVEYGNNVYVGFNDGNLRYSTDNMTTYPLPEFASVTAYCYYKDANHLIFGCEDGIYELSTYIDLSYVNGVASDTFGQKVEKLVKLNRNSLANIHSVTFDTSNNVIVASNYSCIYEGKYNKDGDIRFIQSITEDLETSTTDVIQRPIHMVYDSSNKRILAITPIDSTHDAVCIENKSVGIVPSYSVYGDIDEAVSLNNLVFILQDGNVYSINSTTSTKTLVDSITEDVVSIASTGTYVLAATDDTIYKIDSSCNTTIVFYKEQNNLDIGEIKKLIKFDSSTFAICSKTGTYLMNIVGNSIELSPIKVNDAILSNVSAVAMIQNDDNALIGGLSGLYLFDSYTEQTKSQNYVIAEQIETIASGSILKILSISGTIVVVTNTSIYTRFNSNTALKFSSNAIDAYYDDESGYIIILHSNSVDIVQLNGNSFSVITENCVLNNGTATITCNIKPYLVAFDRTIAFISNENKCYWTNISSIQNQTSNTVQCTDIGLSQVKNLQSNGDSLFAFFVDSSDGNNKKTNSYSQIGSLSEKKIYNFQPYYIYDINSNVSFIVGSNGIHPYYLSSTDDGDEVIQTNTVQTTEYQKSCIRKNSDSTYTMYASTGNKISSTGIDFTINTDGTLNFTTIETDANSQYYGRLQLDFQISAPSNASITKLIPCDNVDDDILYVGTTTGLYKYSNEYNIASTKSYGSNTFSYAAYAESYTNTMLLLRSGTNILSSDQNFDSKSAILACSIDSSFEAVNDLYCTYCILNGNLSTITDSGLASTDQTGINHILIQHGTNSNIFYVKNKQIAKKLNNAYDENTNALTINTNIDSTCVINVFSIDSTDSITKSAIEQDNYVNPKIFFTSSLSSNTLFYLNCACDANGKITSIEEFDQTHKISFDSNIESIYYSDQKIIVYLKSLNKVAIVDISNISNVEYKTNVNSIVASNDNKVYYSTTSSTIIRNVLDENDYYNIGLTGQNLLGFFNIGNDIFVVTALKIISIKKTILTQVNSIYCNDIAKTDQYLYILNDEGKLLQFDINDLNTPISTSDRQYSKLYVHNDILYAVCIDDYHVYSIQSSANDSDASLECNTQAGWTIYSVLSRYEIPDEQHSIDFEFDNSTSEYDYPYIVLVDSSNTQYKVFQLQFRYDNICLDKSITYANDIQSIVASKNVPLTGMKQLQSIAYGDVAIYCNDINEWQFLDGSIVPYTSSQGKINASSLCENDDIVYISDSTHIYQLSKQTYSKTFIYFNKKIFNSNIIKLYVNGDFFTAIVYGSNDSQKLAVLRNLSIEEQKAQFKIDNCQIDTFDNICISNKTLFTYYNNNTYYATFNSNIENLSLYELKGLAALKSVGRYDGGNIYIDANGLYLYSNISEVKYYSIDESLPMLNKVNRLSKEDDRILLFADNNIYAYYDDKIVVIKNSTTDNFLDAQKSYFGDCNYIVANSSGNVFSTSNLKLYNNKLFSLSTSISQASILPKDARTYIVGTNEGIYATQYSYQQIVDVDLMTYDKAMKYYNEELSRNGGISSTVYNTISNHISSDHLSGSIITKLNSDFVDVSASNISSSWQTTNNVSASLIFKNDIVNDIYFGSYEDGDVDACISNFLYTDNDDICYSTGLTYISKRYSSGITEIYINLPTTNTYYLGRIYGAAGCFTQNSLNSERINLKEFGDNVIEQDSIIDKHCTNISVGIASAEYNIDNILDIQINGSSLPLKIYKDDDYSVENGSLFNTFIIPSFTTGYCISSTTTEGNYLFKFSCFGTDEQSIKIMFYDGKFKNRNPKIKIKFNGNGASGIMPAQKFIINPDGTIEQKPLRKNRFSYENTSNGYKVFTGWTLKKHANDSILDNYIVYQDEEEFPNNSVIDELLTELQKSSNYAFKDGDEITLYANWLNYTFQSDDSHFLMQSSGENFSINSVGLDTSIKPNNKVIMVYT